MTGKDIEDMPLWSWSKYRLHCRIEDLKRRDEIIEQIFMRRPSDEDGFIPISKAEYNRQHLKRKERI